MTQLLRVLYITPGGLQGRGGMGGVARQLCSAFAKARPAIMCRVLDSYGPGAFYLMPFYFLRCLGQLMVAGALGRVDVAHIHMSHRGSVFRKLLLLRAAHFFGVPVLLHIHGSEFEVFAESLSPAKRRKLAIDLSRAARIAVLGRSWYAYMVERLGLDAAKLVIVYNGVEVPAQAAQPRPDSDCRIVALGLMSRRKGTPELLEALASPVMRGLRWNALIAGNGDVEGFRAQAAALNLADQVTMPGWIDPAAARAALQTADIFVLPSRNEGLPMAILEAMAAGVAVVTTPVGAIPDLVLPEQTGLLVPAGDAGLLAQALARLIKEPQTRRRLAGQGRERVAASFNAEGFSKQVIDLYYEISHLDP